MPKNDITFSFGENWTDYLETVGEEDIERASLDINEWLGESFVLGKDIIDVGSGSGIHSLAFWRMGARRILSFDFDSHSVSATKKLWNLAGRPTNWTVQHGSVLDGEYLDRLGDFDIVYSWGVLHHTGDMWRAIENSINLVRPGGKYWISIYQKGPEYENHLALKQKYNAASKIGKHAMVYSRVLWIILSRARHLKNPFKWNEKSERGMNRYHDLIDWLGGLPYETATEQEITETANRRGLELKRAKIRNEGACSVYLYNFPAEGSADKD